MRRRPFRRRNSRRAVKLGFRWQEPFDPDPPKKRKPPRMEAEAAIWKAEQPEDTADGTEGQADDGDTE